MAKEYPYVYQPEDTVFFNKNGVFSTDIGMYTIRIVGDRDRYQCYLCEFIDRIPDTDPIWEYISGGHQFRIHQSYLLPAPELSFKPVELIGADALF